MSELLPAEERDLVRVSKLAFEIEEAAAMLRWGRRDHESQEGHRSGLMLTRARELIAVIERCERRTKRIEEMAG